MGIRGVLLSASICSLLSLAMVQAWGQTWVTNTGFASNRLFWEQFNYPVVSTPMLTLNSVSLSPAGASNATPGNVAGATNATLSISNMGLSSSANMTPPAIPLVSVSGQPTVAGAGGRTMMMRRGGQGNMMTRNEHQEMLNTGAAVFDNAYSIPAAPENLVEAAAEIRAWERAHPASKVYTNQDIDRIHQQEANRPVNQMPQPKQ